MLGGEGTSGMNRRDNNPRPPSGVEPPDEGPTVGSSEPIPVPASAPVSAAVPHLSSVPLAPSISQYISDDEAETPAAPSLVDPRLGEILLGRYRLDRLVGKGGMGRVYRATQLPLNRSVAVKILNPEFQRKDPQFVRRFFLEAATAARLTHPNTITVFDYGESERGELFIAMEYLPGKPLARILASEGALDTGRILHIATQICRALREAHGKGIIHRDLKPGNILLVDDGDDPGMVKVLDFGLVKLFNAEDVQPLGSRARRLPADDSSLPPEPVDGELTQAGMFLGSPKYMSPEQIQGVALDPRTDIYSLGVLMYQMATGRPPFAGTTSVEVIYKHVNDPPPPFATGAVDVPPELQAIILRCLAKQREDRYASMGALLVHLKDARRLLVPATLSGESEVDIELSDLTSSLLQRPQSGLLRPLSAVQARPLSGPVPVAPELPFSEEPVPIEDDTGSMLQVKRTARWTWRPAAPWLAGSLFAVVLVMAVGLLWFGVIGPPRASREPGSRLQKVQGQRGGPVAVPRGPERPTAAIHLSSEPAGAEVFEFGVSIGRTPLVHRVPLVARPREYTFKRPGYLSVVQRVEVDGPSVDVRVTLNPESEAPISSPGARRARPKSPDKRPARADEGAGDYKENPY